MHYLNVPADFKLETIDRYDTLNHQYEDAKIIETYGQITIGNTIGSGRAYDLIPSVDIVQLGKYVDYSRKRNIGFNYTLNTTCLGNREFTREGMEEMVSFLEVLYEAGVRSLTVTLPSLIELIRYIGLPFEVKASTVCQIINANKAMSYKRLGVDKIVLDETINRDFEMLQRIRQSFGDQVEVIVNVICHKNCIYEMFHHNQTSHDINENKGSVTYYSHRCMMKRSEDVNNILKLAWIRPEDIRYYTEIGIHYFKIQGRQAVMNGDPVRAAEAYMRRSYDGNLFDLLDMFSPTNSFSIYVDNKKLDGFILPFFENKGFCKNDCEQCGYCEGYIRKCVDYGQTAEVYATATEFYKNCDPYYQMLDVVKKQQLITADYLNGGIESESLNIGLEDFDDD